MSFGQIIKGTILPKVPLKTLFEEDSSSGGSAEVAYQAPKNLPSTEQSTGANRPFVKIGGQIIKSIETLTIDETGFIPTISMTFIDGMGEYAGDYFPKTNLIMNVYMKVGNDKFKPIRCDFLITNIKSIPAKFTGLKKGVGIGTTYMIKGELYIPAVYNNISKSYSKLNSKDALKKICDELGLGFAENESSPNDSMTWVNTNLSNLDFIREIVEHAYQNDDSFFMGFIDKYYYLNYIEVNRQLIVEEAQKTFINTPNALASGISQNVKDSGTQVQLNETTIMNYLTTELKEIGMSNYITELSLISDQGNILKYQGYKKRIYYYDHLKASTTPKDKFKDFYMAPLKSIDRDQKSYLIPEEQSLAESTIRKWMNIDYGNTHPEWNAARLLNSHNLKELDKVVLKATLNNINFQVSRGFTIPVYVSVQQAEKIFKASKGIEDTPVKQGDDAENLNAETADQQLTGYYYVSGVKYHYDSLHRNGLYTEFFLARREWTPSKKTE